MYRTYIHADDAIASIVNEYGRAVPFYDDGPGKLYILWDSMGVVGIVRASSWEDAWECAEDALFPEADETWEAIAKDLGCDPEKLMDDACFQEQYGFRPNGPNATDKLKHGIYAKDLNGETLDATTEEQLADRFHITITWDAAEPPL